MCTETSVYNKSNATILLAFGLIHYCSISSLKCPQRCESFSCFPIKLQNLFGFENDEVRLCLLSRLFVSSFVDFCVAAAVVAVVAAFVVVGVVLFRLCRRIFNTLFRVHVPRLFALLVTCCKMRFVKSQNDMVTELLYLNGMIFFRALYSSVLC